MLPVCDYPLIIRKVKFVSFLGVRGVAPLSQTESARERGGSGERARWALSPDSVRLFSE